MAAHSSSSSLPGLLRTLRSTATLPRSCRRPAQRRRPTYEAGNPSAWPSRSTCPATRSECLKVYGSRSSTTFANVSSARPVSARRQRQPRLRLVDGEHERDEEEDLPGVREHEEGQRRREPCLGRSQRQLAAAQVEQLDPERPRRRERDDRVDEQDVERRVDGREREDRGHVVRQVRRADGAAERDVDEAPAECREREDAGVERDLPQRRAAQRVDDQHPQRRDQGRRQRPEDDHGRHLHRGREAEALAVAAVDAAVHVRNLDQLRQDDRGGEDREGRERALRRWRRTRRPRPPPAPRTIVLAANAPAREGAPVMRFLAGLA